MFYSPTLDVEYKKTKGRKRKRKKRSFEKSRRERVQHKRRRIKKAFCSLTVLYV